MAKLHNVYEHPKEYQKRHNIKYNHRRFISNVEMSIIKHDQAVHNAQVKRNEKKAGNNGLIYDCGCGGRGCFLHRNYKGLTNQAGIDLLNKIMSNAKKAKKPIKDERNELAISRAGFDSKTSFRR